MQRTVKPSAKAKGKEVANDTLVPAPNAESQEVPLSHKVVASPTKYKKLLRIIKKSDYKVVDQLNHTPSKI